MDRVEILGSGELDVPADAPGPLNYEVVLQRGAAFFLCIPPDLKRGMVWIRGRSARDHWKILQFADASLLKRVVIGGLEPGPTEVIYVDKQSRKRSSESLSLERGVISGKRCN
jgi:hypothetical protein